MIKKSLFAGVCVFGLLLLAACSHEGADWKSASAADTSEAYLQFLHQHPKSAFAAQAQARIQQLQEDHDWQVATAADSRDSYQQFLSQHPNSLNAQEARIRLENFAQSAGAGSAPTGPPSVAPPKAAPPKAAPPTAGKPQLASTSGGAHYVQLGAFSSRARAESQWQRLAARFARELGTLTPRYVAGKTRAGEVVRLQVAVNSRAQGQALCEKLRARAQTCVNVSAG
jgi:hypothetical protein